MGSLASSICSWMLGLMMDMHFFHSGPHMQVSTLGPQLHVVLMNEWPCTPQMCGRCELSCDDTVVVGPITENNDSAFCREEVKKKQCHWAGENKAENNTMVTSSGQNNTATSLRRCRNFSAQTTNFSQTQCTYWVKKWFLTTTESLIIKHVRWIRFWRINLWKTSFPPNRLSVTSNSGMSHITFKFQPHYWTGYCFLNTCRPGLDLIYVMIRNITMSFFILKYKIKCFFFSFTEATY